MTGTARDRVGVDLRGIGDAVRAAARARQTTVAAFAREALVEAERLLAAGDFTETMIQAARAVSGIEDMLRNLLPPVSQANVGAANGPGLLNYLSGLRLMSLGALVGFDVRALMRFRALAPRVSKSMSGKWHSTFNGPAQYGVDHATFATTFARDFALAVQRRLST